jgi:hypothetical protein
LEKEKIKAVGNFMNVNHYAQVKLTLGLINTRCDMSPQIAPTARFAAGCGASLRHLLQNLVLNKGY